MTREEKIALLQEVLAGNLEAIRQYKQAFERAQGVVIWEGSPLDPQLGDRVHWQRGDGSVVVESVEDFTAREHKDLIMMPHNGRESLFP